MVKLHIMMLGLRGFPNVQGGVETHVEHLSQSLVSDGCEVEVIIRARYGCSSMSNIFEGITFTAIWSPKSMYLETLMHSFFGVLYAAVKRPDVLHVHAVGSGLFIPFARLLGLRVVLTHHGADYERDKWQGFARWVLRLGESWGVRWANRVISVSVPIKKHIQQQYLVDAMYIPNGVAMPLLDKSSDLLSQWSLYAGSYVLCVGRLVPEKRQADLIEAYCQGDFSRWQQLVIVGDYSKQDAYYKQLLALADGRENIIFTGAQYDKNLSALYQHAGLFVLPSSHEGLPIVMLEALSYGLPVLASDITANKVINLAQKHFFKMGDQEDLLKSLVEWQSHSFAKKEYISRLNKDYRWSDISRQTVEVYRQVIKLS